MRSTPVLAMLAFTAALAGCDEPRGEPPAVHVAAAALESAPPAADEGVDWASVPLVRRPSQAFGSVAIGQAFNEGMRIPENPLTICRTGWKPPPGFGALHLETELRVRSRDGFLVVEDMIVLGGNFGDPEYEECLVRQYRGRRAPAPTVEPGRVFRLDWRIHQYLD